MSVFHPLVRSAAYSFHVERDDFLRSLQDTINRTATTCGIPYARVLLGKAFREYDFFNNNNRVMSKSTWRDIRTNIIAALDARIKMVGFSEETSSIRDEISNLELLFLRYESTIPSKFIKPPFSNRISEESASEIITDMLCYPLNREDYATVYRNSNIISSIEFGNIPGITDDLYIELVSIASWYGMYAGFRTDNIKIHAHFLDRVSKVHNPSNADISSVVWTQTRLMGAMMANRRDPRNALNPLIADTYIEALGAFKPKGIIKLLDTYIGLKGDAAVYKGRSGSRLDDKLPGFLSKYSIKEMLVEDYEIQKSKSEIQTPARLIAALGEIALISGDTDSAERHANDAIEYLQPGGNDKIIKNSGSLGGAYALKSDIERARNVDDKDSTRTAIRHLENAKAPGRANFVLQKHVDYELKRRR